MKKRRKKSSRTKVFKKAELLAKEFVKIRDKRTCQKCGAVVEGSNCHASHVKPVSRSKRLSLDEQNLKVLCYHCHINWWHKNPTESAEWFKAKFPERLAYLNEQLKIHESSGKLTKVELENICIDYILKITELKNAELGFAKR